jgi:hypothetical protein
MFDLFKRTKNDNTQRTLNSPRDLKIDDLITFKPRTVLPDELQGATVTVANVQGYQYSEGLVTEFVIALESGESITFTLEDEEDGEYICFSKKISRDIVSRIFDMEAFAGLFGEGFQELQTSVEIVPEQLRGWIAHGYYQFIKEAPAYFYKADRRNIGVSQYEDDDSEELRYHQCEGAPDEYSLYIEIWEDGSTDVFLQKSVPLNVIEEMWPNG